MNKHNYCEERRGLIFFYLFIGVFITSAIIIGFFSYLTSGQGSLILGAMALLLLVLCIAWVYLVINSERISVSVVKELAISALVAFVIIELLLLSMFMKELT